MLISYYKKDKKVSTIKVTEAQKELIKYLCYNSYNVRVPVIQYISDLYKDYKKSDKKYNFSEYVRDILFKEYLNLLYELEEIEQKP